MSEGLLGAAVAVLGGEQKRHPHLGPAALREAWLVLKAEATLELIWNHLLASARYVGLCRL